MTNLNDRRLLKSILEDLSVMNGTEFEAFCKYIMNMITGEEIKDIGHNLCAKPIRSRGDLSDNQYEIIGQCGTDEDYFSIPNLNNYNNPKPVKKGMVKKKQSDPKNDKPIKDAISALTNHPKTKELYLFSNRVGADQAKQAIIIYIKQLYPNLKVIIYDGTDIANYLVSNTSANKSFTDALKLLPASYSLYSVYAEKYSLPTVDEDYIFTNQETKIINSITTNNIVELYGISGVGKTELAKNIISSICDKYDVALWFDSSFVGDSIDFSSIKIERYNKEINLEYYLKNYKCLLIFDNINSRNEDLVQQFKNSNTKESSLIITSLSKHFSDDISIEIQIHEEEFINLFFDKLSIKLNNSELEIINKYVGGYPLGLKLIKGLILIDQIPLVEILNDIQNIPSYSDSDKQQKVAERLLSRYLNTYNTEFQFLIFCRTEILSKAFVTFNIGSQIIRDLRKRSIIKGNDNYHIEIHSLIYNSISELIPNITEELTFISKTKDFLLIQSEKKSLIFYKFMFLHNNLITYLGAITNDAELKKIISYCLIQASDLARTKKALLSDISAYNLNNHTLVDVLLIIEKSELELQDIDRKSSEYLIQSMVQIDTLEAILKNTTNRNAKIIILHHIGKIFSKIEEYKKAEEYFNKVLSIEKNFSPTLLQITRIKKKQNDIPGTVKIIEQFFESVDLDNDSITILLSFYQEISNNKLKDLRSKYIDNNIEEFVKLISYVANEEFDLPYRILENLSDHLGYNKREDFLKIVSILPFPANLYSNLPLMKAYARIQLANYKALKFKTDKSSPSYLVELNESYASSEDFFINSNATDDVTLKKHIELYILGEEYDKALKIIDKFQNPNTPYNLQMKCKVKRALNDFNGSLIDINNAITIAEEDGGYYHFSAFYHDKAITEFEMGNSQSLESLRKAIQLQETPTTKKNWENKLIDWETKFENRN